MDVKGEQDEQNEQTEDISPETDSLKEGYTDRNQPTMADARTRQLTEKGLSFAKETKFKQLAQTFRNMKTKSEEISRQIADKGAVMSVRPLYSDWLDICENFLKLSDEYCQLLNLEEKEDYFCNSFDQRDIFMRNFKTATENWFVSQPTDLDTASKHLMLKTKSRVSKSSIASSLTSERLREQQRKAELTAKINAVKEREEIEIAKLRLRTKEEEFNLYTEMTILDAKSRVLDQFEYERDAENLNTQNIPGNELSDNDNKSKNKVKGPFGLLNPSANPFVPYEHNTHVNTQDNTHVRQPYGVNVEHKYVNESVVSGIERAYDRSDVGENVAERAHLHNTENRMHGHGLMSGAMDAGGNTDRECNNGYVSGVIDNGSHAGKNFVSYPNNNNILYPPTNHSGQPVNRPPHEDISLSVVRHLRKPSFEVNKFGGDPMEFRRFIRQFEAKVVANADNDHEKMNCLEQYTVGEAKRVVTMFTHLDSSQAYPAAMTELYERYGDTQVIASAFIKKALDWPIMKPNDIKMLDEFSIFLVECENAIGSIESMRLLEYPDNLKRLVAKLPFYLHDRWRNLVYQSKKNDRVIRFRDLVRFIKDEVRKASDPVFGKEALGINLPSKDSSTKRSFPHKSKLSFATNSLEETTTNKPMPVNNKGSGKQTMPYKSQVKYDSRYCKYCETSTHSTEMCTQLGGLSVRDRFNYLKSKGLCFNCLRYGHMKKDCRTKVICTKCDSQQHPTVLHREGRPSEKDDDLPRKLELTQEKKDTHSSYPNVSSPCGHIGAGGTNFSMAIIPVKVRLKNKMQTVDTYAFYDSGSSISFCSKGLLEQLGGTGKSMRLTIDTMGTPFTMTTSAVTGLQVSDLESNNIIDLPRVYTKDRLPVSREHIPKQEDIANWSHLNDIKLTELDSDVGLMIGCNVPDAYAPLQVRTGPMGSPHATETRLGWVMWSVVKNTDNKGCSNVSVSDVVNRTEISAIQNREEFNKLDHMLRESINRDFPENLGDDRKEKSQDDRKFLEQAERSVCMVDGHYCLDLPFRDRNIRLPNNQLQGLQRLKGLRQKMLKNHQFREDYTMFMEQILQKNYAERVPDGDLQRDDGFVWYIPHHGVYHPRKPGKIRVVFDCSASFMGVSLNNLLLSGPDLTNGLLGVLIRFRQESIPIMGDIEAMFFQVRVSQNDVDCLRFFWWPNGDVDQEPIQYRMLVHLFGAVSSPSCSNFALRRTAHDNTSEFGSPVTKTVENSMYVDDMLASRTTEEEAISLIKDTSALCLKGGFRLTKWVSSNRRVIESVPEEERSKDFKEFDFENDPIPCERALGVFWSIENDAFGFKIQIKDQPMTRRGILSMVSSLYDPIGIASPFVLRAKILLQDLCKRNMGWDVEIPDDDRKLWQSWLNDLPHLEKLRVKRCYKPDGFGVVTSCQIHSFADASQQGYGAVFYLRLINDKNEVHCAFLCARSRVAPLKKITIPRMELTAATVAVRLYKTILRELEYPVDRTYFWTDSMSVICYVANETTRFRTFVANRIEVIRAATSTGQWMHVESKRNPADIASRGVSALNLLQSEQWLHGPEFLWNDVSEWPHSDTQRRDIPQDDPEVYPVGSTSKLCTTNSPLERVLNHLSDWSRLKKTVGWMLVALHNLKRFVAESKEITQKIILENSDPIVQRQMIDAKILKNRELRLSKGGEHLKSSYVPLEIIKKAEHVILKYVQHQHFSEEFDSLTGAGQHILRKNSPLRKLDPFVDSDDLLRVGGRLERANIPFDAKHPVLLPKQSRVTKLIIEYIHQSIGHLGKNAILAKLRQKYWILGVTSVIKSMMRLCTTCRKYQARGTEQKMANLPARRLQSDDPPFTRSGMDYFGPFEIKRARSVTKRYGVIFTCLSIRAVHLEVAASLDTDSCIHAIRRFIARRGPVKHILSDNGTNLVGADRELKRELEKLNTGKIREFSLKRGISWEFNPPASSHFGGVWERLIRSVRKILYGVMKDQVIKLDDEGLQTLFCEVEGIINNRPLTEPSNQPNDLEVLTPNHLLLLQPGEDFPPGVFEQTDVYARRRWRQIQFLADQFWGRWVKEYLPLLQARQKWLAPRRNISVGDLVLVMDNTPRNSWCLGRILEVIKDNKGFVRIAKVKTRSTVLKRPVAKLCLILESDLEQMMCQCKITILLNQLKLPE